MFVNFAAVALGGALGACARYAAGLGVELLVPAGHALAGLPVATLAVNFLGCFAIGIASHFFLQTDLPNKDVWRLFGITGVLGGFTTFSTFSLESIDLIQGGEAGLGLAYIAASLVLCLAGVCAGRLVAHSLWGAAPAA